jgi:hypothetical protein
MKFRLRDIMGAIDESDLYKMHQDLAKGGIYMKKLVSDQLHELEHQKMTSCATCGRALDDKNESFTIVFGPDDFRKKASFCELDCLEYFLTSIRTLSEQVTGSEQITDGEFDEL